MTAHELANEFLARYSRPARLFYAPGRINLIGEHTDYNDGFVMPFAINRGTTVAAAARPDRMLRVHSTNLGQTADIDLDSSAQGPRHSWIDYIEGMARCLEQRGARLRGADLLVSSNLALGAGLSSSAALEISLAFALLKVSNQHVDPISVVLAAQKAEHRYVGTESGIMDQYIATFAKAGSCLLIDCRSLESQAIPLPQAALIICDTGVKHELASSEYNRRRAECIEGVRQIQQRIPTVRSLRDVSVSDFQALESHLSEPQRRRCRHVITENRRTVDAAAALSAGDLASVGQLMYESHRSLTVDYEVSSSELNVLVNASHEVDGVWGARMTGGGFGGCTITLLRHDSVDRFINVVQSAFRREFHSEAKCFASTSENGARELNLR